MRVIIILLLALAGGCTTVQPWERATLSRTGMAFEPDRLEAQIESHIQFSKEASTGGSAAAGGGCGCN